MAVTKNDLLQRLWGDQRGNAAVLMAAAFLPVLCLIGSGLDLSRAYLVKSKMQVACDAGSLAARRAMASSTLDATSKAEGTKFFNFNFPAGTMDAAPVNLAIVPDPADVSTVDMSATTAVPTTIMGLFGIDELPIAVECSADQDYVNNDIMLVLDVTGSMNCTAGTNCAYAATEQTKSRLSRLRLATASLYTTLEGAKGVRTRYGFMPYSMTVNVGADLQSSWIRNPANYWQKTGNNWAQASVNHSSGWFRSSWSGCLEERSTISQGSGNAIRISSDVAAADIDQTGTGNALRWAPYDDAATVGEVDPLAENLARFCPAPATRLATYSSVGAFQRVVDDSLSRVGGYTHHDLGMMWGMRYLSPTGMFASDNLTVVNQVPVAKHIIFLTDGVMTSGTGNYSAYGVPNRETRLIQESGNSVVERHTKRFLNACNRARQMAGGGTTIWVIVIDESNTSEIQGCASGSDHFWKITSNDENEYKKVFQQIGKGIGRLRLTS